MTTPPRLPPTTPSQQKQDSPIPPIHEERPIPPPASVPERIQKLSNLYTMKDHICDTIAGVMLKQGTYIKWLPKLITEFLPIYNFSHPQKKWGASHEKEPDFMRVALSHCNTVASNAQTKFGAVAGTHLDPRVDHVISVRLDMGVEFGLGICDEHQMKSEPTKRDFMCCEGGFGYYNYKTKSARMKPKYPPGLYCQTNAPVLVRDERDIVKEGDVLTMVIQRQDVPTTGNPLPGGGSDNKEEDKEDLRGPIKTLRPGRDGLISLSYYLNGKSMGFNLTNLKPKGGRFYVCLNYYFVESTVRVLSDYKFSALSRARRCETPVRKSKTISKLTLDTDDEIKEESAHEDLTLDDCTINAPCRGRANSWK